MFERLVQHFIPNDQRHEVERYRAARLLVSAALLTGPFSLGYIALSFFVGFEPGIWAMVFNAASFPILPFVFRKTRSIGLVANLYVLIGFIGVGIVVFYSGGFASPILPWFVVLPIAAVLLDGPRSGWPWTAIALGTVALFAGATLSGYPFPYAVPEPYRALFAIGDHLGLVLLIFVIALVFQSEKQRAFGQLHAKNRELEVALEDLRRTQAQLIHSEKMASLGQLTTGIAHELQNPLNFVNNFASLSVELIDELESDLQDGAEDGEALAFTLHDLRQNCERIQEHGRRAEQIIRGMMRHGADSRGERRLVDLNEMVEQFVNIALHGRKARDPVYAVEFERRLDPSVGPVVVQPAEIGRVLVNVLDNAFAAVEARATGAEPSYEPTVTLKTQRRGETVELTVGDNGVGMPESVRRRVFEPFFTTRPAGTGTGLGLSMAYDIVVEGHGGSIDVESAEGEGTTVSITLPAGAEIAL